MGWHIIEHEGKRFRVAAVRDGRRVWVSYNGLAVKVESAQAFASEAGADDRIVAPMTGKVVQVAVAEGDSVSEDQLLVVMEAMKMEYRLTAPTAGVVEAVQCEEGQMVDVGAILVTLEEQD